MTGSRLTSIAPIPADRQGKHRRRGRFRARTLTSPLALALEPRFMFDAAGVATGGEAAVDAAAQEAADQQTDSPSADDPADPLAAALSVTTPPADRTEIVFVDPNIHNYQALLTDVHAAAEVVILDPAADGLTQIADFLSGQSDVDAVHIVSHGDVGALAFGSGIVDIGNLADYADPLSRIGAALAPEGDILLYGCSTGADGAGTDFLTALSDATGADIAASDDPTGAADRGGDWVLEQTIGSVSASDVRASLAEAGYAGLLGISNEDFDDEGLINNVTTSQVVGDWTFESSANTRIVTPEISENEVNLNRDDGAGDRTLIFLDVGNNVTTFSFKSTDGTDFDLSSFDIGTSSGSSSSLTITGLRDGGTVVTGEAVDLTASDSTGNISYSFAETTVGGSYGTLTFNTAFDLVDEIRFVFTGPAALEIDNIVAAVPPTNTAPVLDAGASPSVTTITEDAGDDDGSGADGDDDATNNANNLGDSIADLVVDGSITDADGGAVEAIAVVEVYSFWGRWQYSTDNGATWANFTDSDGTVDLSDNARLLDGTLTGSDTHRIRYVPSDDYNGSRYSITFRAWDKTTGSAGGTADASSTGGTTAFSSATNTATITVTNVNDAPTVTGIPVDLSVTEDSLSSLDLRTLDFYDIDADHVTVTLTASAGTLVATAGHNATIGSVTSSVISATTISFYGSASNLDSYFNNVWRVRYTGASNVSGDDAATVTLTLTDGMDAGVGGTINLDITAVQDAPLLDDSASPGLTAVAEDAGDDDGSGADGDDDATSNANNPGTSVADLVADGSITDPDGGAVEAIAVIAVDNTNGVWQYSTDNGTNWNSFSGTTGSSVDIASAARLLDGTLTGAGTHLVRFVPDADYNGSATITFRAWDKTSGSAGSTANTGSTGDATAFSSASDTASITVTAVNDAPTVSGLPSDIGFLEDTTGALDLWTAGFADIDGDSLTVTLTASAGTLAAGTSGGVTVGGSGTGTLTLAGTAAAINTWLGISSNIQYTPASDAIGDDAATVTVNANDGTVNPLLGTVNIDITAQNDAPVLNVGASPTLAGITEDAGDDDGSGADGDDDATSNANNPGTSVADLVADGSITDPDGSAVEAIAVIAVDNTNGVWQYSTDNGTSWNSFSGTTGTTVDIAGTARLLDGTLTGSNTHLVRFVPDADYNGSATITFRAWDKTSGSAGGTADTGSTGGTTPFSSVSDMATVTVTAVNDAPVLGPGTNLVNYTEGGEPIVVFSYITLTDPDTANFASATVSISGGSIPGDVLSAGVTTPFVASYDTGTYTLTLTGPGTRAQLEAALRTVTFHSTSDDPTENGTRNLRALQFQVIEDGTAVTSNAQYAQVRMTGLNDEPTLTATGTNPTFVEGSAAPGADLFDTVAVSTVEANQTVTGMTLTVTNVTDGPAEVLHFDGSDVALTHGNAITSATNGLLVTVSLAGTTATVAFSGASLSADALRTLVDGLAYSNTSDTLTEADRVITITRLTDDGGTADGGSDTATPNLQSTVTVAATNEAPAIAGDLAIAVAEGGTVTVTTTDLTEADPDDSGTGLTYTVTTGPAHGQLELTTNPTVAITAFTQADLDNGWVVYRHDGSQTASDSIRVSLADGGENSVAPATGLITITVVADQSESDDGDDTPVPPQPDPPTADTDTAPTPPAPDVTDPAIGPETVTVPEVVTSTRHTDPQTITEIMAATGDPETMAIDGPDLLRAEPAPTADTGEPVSGEPAGLAAPVGQTDPLFFGFPLDEVVLYSADGAELAAIDSRDGVLNLVAETTDGGNTGDRVDVLMVMERLGLFADGTVRLSELRGEIGLFGMTLAEMVAALQGEPLGEIDSLGDLQSALDNGSVVETDAAPETSASILWPGAPTFAAQIAGAFDSFDREAATLGAALARMPAAPQNWLNG